MENTILELKGLRKTYKKVVALKELSFTVERGQIFGLLGPNGSGKTTTLGILLGVLRQDEGSFSWFGNGTEDTNRKRIGALLETPNFYPYMSAYDNLVVIAKIKGMEDYHFRIEQVLQRVRLFERRKSAFSTYSLGMKQRLAIAATMLSDPEVLVLDEPTNGLDPQGIAEIRDLIREIAAEGKTIIIASHILDEIEKICTHVAIMRQGELLQIGELGDIMTQDKILLLKSDDVQQIIDLLPGIEHTKFMQVLDGEIMIAVGDKIGASEINKEFAAKGLYLSGIREYRKTLETTFLDIINS